MGGLISGEHYKFSAGPRQRAGDPEIKLGLPEVRRPILSREARVHLIQPATPSAHCPGKGAGNVPWHPEQLPRG